MFIFLDTEYSKTLYNQAIRVAKHINLSTVKAAFGFQDSDKIGSAFYTSMQAVPTILKSVKEGRNIPYLIPLALDQDPHFRVRGTCIPGSATTSPRFCTAKWYPDLGQRARLAQDYRIPQYT